MRPLLTAALLLAALPALAQQSETVHFAAGNDNASVQSSVTGDAYRDYVLGASAGQTMAVSLSAKGSAYFNVMAPGSTGEAIYIGSLDGNDATGVKLAASGDYTVRVYLMGNDASTGKTVPFTLSMSVQ